MTKEKEARIRFIYTIVLSALTVLVGVLFIFQTWSIYGSAPQSPYTRDTVAARFGEIAVPIGIWVAAIVGGNVLYNVFPVEKKRPKPYIDVQAMLARVERRLPTDERSQNEVFAVRKKQKNSRIVAFILGSVVAIVLGALILCIMLDWLYMPIVKTEFFASHHAVVDRIFQSAILAIVALTVVSVVAWYIEKSKKTEYKAYLEVIATAKKEGRAVPAAVKAEKPSQKQENGKAVLTVRIGLAVVGVAFVVWGVCNGGMQDVLLKAINICTQCIGLG